MSTPAIPGLPPGAIVKPLAARGNVQGLPPGAIVKPIGGTPTPAPTAAPALPNTDPAAEQQDTSVMQGVWNTTLAPLWDKFKGYLQDPKSWATDVITKGGNPIAYDMAKAMLLGAYEEGRKAAKHGVAAGKEFGAGASDLLHGDIAGASQHGNAIAQEQSLASGHALAAAIPGIGPAAAQAGEKIGTGKPKEGTGEAIGLIGQTLLGGVLGRKATAPAKMLESGEAIEQLTNAVNPAAEHMPKFRADLGEQLGRITDYAERNSIDLAKGGRTGFMKAMQGAAEEAQNFYNKNVLEPVADRVAPNGQTYGELEARLRHLNRTTNYNATTAAESEAMVARKAEANSIRQTLNEGLAKELNITPKEVAELRAAGEKLGDLADKTELAMDIEKHAANAQARSSITIHAHHGGAVPGTPVGGGRFSAAATRGMNKVLGHPADNAVNKVFQKFNAPKPSANPQVTPPRQSPPRTPAWQTNPQEPVTVGGQDFTPDVEGARTKLQVRKNQGDASKLNRQMQAAADALQKEKTRAMHPMTRETKTRVNGSAESDASMEAVNELKSRQAKGVEYVIKRPGGSTRPVMKTALRPEDNPLNPGETLWKKHPDGRMEKVK